MSAALVTIAVVLALAMLALLWFLGDDRSSEVDAHFDEAELLDAYTCPHCGLYAAHTAPCVGCEWTPPTQGD